MNPSNKKCDCPATDPPYKIIVYTREKRLELYQGGRLLGTYPVAVGKPASPTPRGNFKIINKDDTPGPRFGSKWLGLSVPHIGIHGTNEPESIGTAASEGCIRMFNRDVEALFYRLPLGTPVTIL